MVEPVSGPTKVEKCGEGCIDVWVGQIGDNYWKASCAFFEAAVSFNVVSPNAVTEAKLEEVYWDDYIQVYVDGDAVFDTRPNLSRCDAHPPNNHFVLYPFTDVTAKLRPQGQHTLKLRVLVGNGGEGYARIRIRFDPKAAITKDRWVSLTPDCPGLAAAMSDGMCADDHAVCTVDPGVWDGQSGQNCIGFDGLVRICEADLSPPPLDGISRTCSRAEYSATCDFDGTNAPCWTDGFGGVHCPNQVTGQADTCKALEQRGCAFIRSDCVEGANGSSTGICWLYKDVYDCGTSITVPVLQSASARYCAGPVRCMGEECVEVSRAKSPDFLRAAAALNTVQQMAMDKDCAVANDLSTCTVFKGQGGTCKTVGALVTSIDCCNAPKSVGLGQYLDLMTRVSQVDNAVMRLDAANAVRGSWEVLRTPVADTLNAVKNTVASTADSITGGYSSVATDFLKDSLVGQFSNMAMEQVATWVGETFGSTAGNLIFSSGGSAAFSQSGALNPGVTGSTLQVGGGGAMIGSLLNAVMVAYAVYQILVVIVQLIWQCEQKEYELAAKKSLRSCTYLGSYCNTKVFGACMEERESYCCYSSPLARILQEQIRPQLGMPYGDIKQPDCSGIPVNRLAEVDWNRVNLDEWLAILKITNRLPTAGNALEKLNLDQLTGQGSHFNIDGSRTNTLDRNVQRLAPLDVNGIRKQSESEGWAAGH